MSATAEVAGPFKVESKPYVITAKAFASAPVSEPVAVSVSRSYTPAPPRQVKLVFAVGAGALFLVGIVIIISIVVGIVLAIVLIVKYTKRSAQ